MSPPKQHCALVTGASSGIGQATALAFAEAGVNLILLGRSQDRLKSVAKDVESIGAKAWIYTIDLSDLSQVQPRLEDIIAESPPIDIWVNNAGIAYTGQLLDTPLSDWQLVLDLNLTSVFLCIQAILPGMRDRQHGTIINVASIAAHQAFPGWGAYNVSKAGILALTKTLAGEERANGIRVMSISPGAVNTPIWDTDTVDANFDRTKMLTPDVIAQSIVQMSLMPNHAVIEDMVLMPSAGAL